MVEKTFVVVTEFETTRFAKGWVMLELWTFVRLFPEPKRLVTLRVVMLARDAKTFVVVTEFETTRFASGWVMLELWILESAPPSP
jgi:hypothetical protein